MSSVCFKVLLYAFAVIWLLSPQSTEGYIGHCKSALGMQSKVIPDQSISASSTLSTNHVPAFARLDERQGAWCSAPNDNLPYVQILLDVEKLITKITTQGSYKDMIWATKYQIKYLKDGKWFAHQKADRSLTLEGNTNVQALEEHDLQPPIRTHSIRIYPMAPRSVMPNDTSQSVSCLRLELYGCSVSSCGPPIVPDNSDIAGSHKTSYKFSDKVFLRCKTGYFSRGRGLLMCGLDGWMGPYFTCSPKRCGYPGIPQNGKLYSDIFTFKRKVYFECNHGYKLVGDKYRQCQANQSWSGRLPTCEPIDCGVLQTPDKGEKVLETHTRVGGVVRFECKEKGYEISGSEIRTCQNDGLWSGFPTSCKIKNCGDPGTPDNGKQTNVKNGYNYGGSVEFICKDNYTLSGRSKIYCEETKDWSSPIPRCWAPCPDPGVLGNGSRIGDDFRHGKSVTFKCNDDYELKGKASIGCNDGSWSDDTPQCTVISCADPGSPVHGRQVQVSNNFAVGGFVRFKCNENYTLLGKSKLTCQRNKKWNGDIPKCLAPCLDPGQPTNGRRAGSVFNHDSVVQFECLGDRSLKGSSEMKCDNGQWDAKLPTCIDCKGGIPLGMRSEEIPDKSITASSQTDQHPAHHGRLGRDSYWCSKDERSSYIEIRLPKRYKITEARVKIQNSHNIRYIVLLGQPSRNHWINYHFEKAPYNSDVERILPEPFIAQSLRIKLRKKAVSPICLRAEVYGCEIPRGCILRGSAVVIKQKDGYRKGYVASIFYGLMEVFPSGEHKSTLMNRADVVLDEKPNAHELAKGTLVVGEDVNSPGSIREGKIEQIGDSYCIIKTNDETWSSNLNDVRIVKIPDLCQS